MRGQFCSYHAWLTQHAGGSCCGPEMGARFVIKKSGIAIKMSQKGTFWGREGSRSLLTVMAKMRRCRPAPPPLGAALPRAFLPCQCPAPRATSCSGFVPGDLWVTPGWGKGSQVCQLGGWSPLKKFSSVLQRAITHQSPLCNQSSNSWPQIFNFIFPGPVALRSPA